MDLVGNARRNGGTDLSRNKPCRASTHNSAADVFRAGDGVLTLASLRRVYDGAK